MNKRRNKRLSKKVEILENKAKMINGILSHIKPKLKFT